MSNKALGNEFFRFIIILLISINSPRVGDKGRAFRGKVWTKLVVFGQSVWQGTGSGWSKSEDLYRVVPQSGQQSYIYLPYNKE